MPMSNDVGYEAGLLQSRTSGSDKPMEGKIRHGIEDAAGMVAFLKPARAIKPVAMLFKIGMR